MRTWVWYSAIFPSATVALVSRISIPSMPRIVFEASVSASWAAARHESADTPTRSIVLITAIVGQPSS